MQRGLYMNCATADSYLVSVSVAVSGVVDSWQRDRQHIHSLGVHLWYGWLTAATLPSVAGCIAGRRKKNHQRNPGRDTAPHKHW